METENIFIALGQALFAVFGSCVKWLNIKDSRKRKMFSLVSEAMSAAFSGILVYMLYKWLDINVHVSFAIAGIVGHNGAIGLDMLGKFVVHYIGFKVVNSENDEIDLSKR